MPKLLFITKNLNGASTRYRALGYADQLRNSGWTVSQWSSKGGLRTLPWLIKATLQSDVVMIQRKLLSPPILCLVRALNTNLIYDFDDAVFLKDNGSKSKHRYKLFRKVTQSARMIFAGNQYLADQARLFNPQVTVLPTTVNINKYEEAHNTNSSETNTIDLVWIGSSSTRKYLEDITPILEKLGQQYPQLRLKIIADFDLPLKHLVTIPIEWSEKCEAHELASSCIGIAPMTENPWTKGKCALKIIQYMAAGLPVVSSCTGANKEVVVDEETGFLVNTENEWISAIGRLINDKPLRQAMASKGFERAKNNYSQEYGVNVMLEILNHLFNSHRFR